MERTQWVDRKFTFDMPEGWIFNVLERLRGAPIRLERMVDGYMDETLRLKPDGKWSVKEHIGHLYDLEDLHEGRIDDFVVGKTILRAADMSNAVTKASPHNDRSIDMLVSMYYERRNRLIEKFERLKDETHFRKALHPRLQTDMRPIDVAYFTAEHDDHHIAFISEILRGGWRVSSN